MSAAVEHVNQAEGAVGVLINNAGYSQSGAVESIPLDRRAKAVRDQRVRAGPDVSAGAARNARPALGQDRQHRLDGGQARVPGRRHLPRDQVRDRGAQRRTAVRSPRLRRRRDPDRTGADQERLRRGRRRLGHQERRGSVRRFQPPRREGDRGGLRRAADEARWAGPRRSRTRSPRRSMPTSRGRATRSRRARTC